MDHRLLFQLQQVFNRLRTPISLLDAEGNILYLDSDSLYSSRALMPGSSIMIRFDIPSSQMDYFAEKKLVPISVDAIAYVIVDAD